MGDYGHATPDDSMLRDAASNHVFVAGAATEEHRRASALVTSAAVESTPPFLLTCRPDDVINAMSVVKQQRARMRSQAEVVSGDTCGSTVFYTVL